MIIKCHINYLKARLAMVGYSVDEVADAIIQTDGDYVFCDLDSPAFPRSPKPGFVFAVPRGIAPASSGPGTELKALLAKIGIKATPNCSCNARAREMDANGIDWCEANLDTIVGWLREEATNRGLPFLDAAGRLLVRRAIRNARRAAS